MARHILSGFLEHGDGGHDLSGRAVTGLKDVAFHERRLHGVMATITSESFDGRDLVLLMGDAERESTAIARVWLIAKTLVSATKRVQATLLVAERTSRVYLGGSQTGNNDRP